jgi:peptidoglycan hydrolase-like protein with peptidoglycan-binding domain
MPSGTITVKLQELIAITQANLNNTKVLNQEKANLLQEKANLQASLTAALANDASDAATITAAQQATTAAQQAAVTAQESLAQVQAELDAKIAEVQQLQQQLASTNNTNNDIPYPATPFGIGASGPGIVELHNRLNAWRGTALTGDIYTEETAAAISALQSDEGLPITGICDRDTLGKLHIDYLYPSS